MSEDKPKRKRYQTAAYVFGGCLLVSVLVNVTLSDKLNELKNTQVRMVDIHQEQLRSREDQVEVLRTRLSDSNYRYKIDIAELETLLNEANEEIFNLQHPSQNGGDLDTDITSSLNPEQYDTLRILTRQAIVDQLALDLNNE